MPDWKIQSNAHLCQACGVRFQEGSQYHTLLFNEASGYERFDICGECWVGQFKDEARNRKEFISHWRGTYHEPPPPPPEPLQKETAETLLRKLVNLNDSRYLAASYILAAMLERKRILRIKGQDRRNGQRIFIYEQPKTGDVFTIPDPDLRLDQLEAVQREVTDLLENGLPEEQSSQESEDQGNQEAVSGNDASHEHGAEGDETVMNPDGEEKPASEGPDNRL